MNGGFGQLPYDVAHLLDGAALALSFVLLYQRRVAAVVNTYAAQAWVLAAAVAWQGFLQGAPELYGLAFVTLAAKGLVIPVALHRIIRRFDIRRSVETALGIFPSLALGFLCVLIAVLAVLPATASAGVAPREDLAMALSVVLLGLLAMTTRRNAATQAIGFLSVENGLILAALGAPGMPMLLEFSAAVLVLIAFVVLGLFLFRIRARFDSLDVSHLDQIAGSPR